MDLDYFRFADDSFRTRWSVCAGGHFNKPIWVSTEPSHASLLKHVRPERTSRRGIAMKFTTFLLDQWLQQHAETEFNLGGSTGPRWTPRQLLALAEDTSAERILDLDLDYTPTPGSTRLREAIANMQGVSAEAVNVFAGSAEALFQIFYLAAEPGANVIIPFPCFPSHQVIPDSLGLEILRYHLSRENSYCIEFYKVNTLANSKKKIVLVTAPNNHTQAT